MIIRIDGGDASEVEAARRELDTLVIRWGHHLDQRHADPAPPASADDHDRGVDPVAVAALVVSLPSAALAALDLADRIRARRRARDLIDQARRLTSRRVVVSLIAEEGPVEIATLEPDRLLDLVADDAAPRVAAGTGEPDTSGRDQATR